MCAVAMRTPSRTRAARCAIHVASDTHAQTIHLSSSRVLHNAPSAALHPSASMSVHQTMRRVPATTASCSLPNHPLNTSLTLAQPTRQRVATGGAWGRLLCVHPNHAPLGRSRCALCVHVLMRPRAQPDASALAACSRESQQRCSQEPQVVHSFSRAFTARRHSPASNFCASVSESPSSRVLASMPTAFCSHSRAAGRFLIAIYVLPSNKRFFR